MQTLTLKFFSSYLVKLAVATVVYGLVLWGSLYLVPAGGSGASLVWPPAALGLAILWFWGIELWPSIAIAFFGVLLLRGGVAPPLIATTAVGNVLEAVITVYILRRYVNFSAMLGRLRDTLGLIIAAASATLVSSTVIVLGIYIFNQAPAINTALWIAIWVGHFVSLISLGPFALRWLERPLFTKTSREVVEGVAGFGLLTTLTILQFWTPYGSFGGISILYGLILVLIWAALRTGPRGLTLALFIFASIGATGVLFGYGPITGSPNLSQALFGVQMVIGILSLIFLLFASITEERKEAVITLEAHVGKLEKALSKISSEDQAKSDFIAILAHELRNPLSPILSGLELLKTEERASPEILKMMGAHLNTTARLLDDLLDISRISQKRFKLQKEPVEIKQVVAHALEMVHPTMESRRHTLTTTLPDEEIWFSADPVRLSQIFVNLLNNAAKYTDPGGTIGLHISRQGSELVAEVKDSGIGIAPHRLSKVFEPFGGSEPGGHRPGGLRIGLSLAQRMAQMHHGSVSAHSQGEGKGATFIVRLPLPPTMHLPMPEPQRGGVRSRFSKDAIVESREKLGTLTILVVDDNEAAAEGLRKLLEHHGHTVRVAYDAPPALEMIAQEPPDVAILDIGLPTMDGYLLAKKIRERFGKKVGLIALTGYGQSDDKQKAKDAGFDEHLVKPVSVVDVQRVLLELNIG
jgi:signal transduction histidine kinase